MHVVLDMDLGGLQRIVNLLIKRMNYERFEPYLCCLDRGGLFCDEFTCDDVHSSVLGRRPGPFDMKMFRKLIKILKGSKIDIIHSHNGCSLYAAMAGKVCGIQGIIHTDHGRLVPDRKTAIWEDRIASLMMDRFVSVSNQLTEYLTKTVKVNEKILCTIVNGIDTDRFVPIAHEKREEKRVKLNLNVNARIIGTVCRLDPIKNLKLLIDSVPVILQKIPDCQVVIVGDGPDEKNLRDQASRLNLNSKVIFTGRVTDIEKVMPIFDLYVNTSVSEGTSMTILEAMSCGLPVIASDVGGNAALVDTSGGALFPSGQADMFQNSVINILSNPTMLREMGEKSRRKVKSRFSFDHVVEQYENLYHELVDR